MSAHDASVPALIPQPLSVRSRPGAFTIDDTVTIVAEGAAAGPAWLLHDVLRAGTGLAVPVAGAAGGPAITLTIEGEAPEGGLESRSPSTAAERHTIDVTPDGITVTAAHPAGLARAVQTLRQLLPAHVLRRAAARPGPVEVPAVSIVDEPRFAWRGVMLDVARHFLPKADVLKQIDTAALHRLNVVHLHLTEDQGWRVEIPSWPKLTEIGSWRTETVVGHGSAPKGFDGTPHGGYYTLDDLREIVAYAAVRHITVVPEIDLPGHVRSVLAAYPELGNTDVEKAELSKDPQPGVARTWGIFDEVLAPSDAAIGFITDVLDVVVDVFPSPFIHIGGDEVPRKEWRASAFARAKAEELGLESTDLLQSWFTRQMAEHLASHGRRLIGWDEILDGGAPADAAVMVWRDFSITAKALAAGHQVVVAPAEQVYLDHYGSEHPDEPLHIFGNNSVEKIDKFEPVPEGAISDDILGVQAQLWSEYMKDVQDVEYRAYPRLAVVADIAWSSGDVRAAAPVLDRLPEHLHRLDALGVNYRPLSGPHPWQKGGTGARARFDLVRDRDEHDFFEDMGLPPLAD